MSIVRTRYEVTVDQHNDGSLCLVLQPALPNAMALRLSMMGADDLDVVRDLAHRLNALDLVERTETPS